MHPVAAKSALPSRCATGGHTDSAQRLRYTFHMISVEEVVRSSESRTAQNGLPFGLLGDFPPGMETLERMVGAVPRSVVQRLGRTATYFVPWLLKQRRGIAVALANEEADDSRKELCHHLDLRSGSRLLLISTNFYADDLYGIAMEFFDKIAYVAMLDPDPKEEDYFRLLERQINDERGGELTPEAWDWRKGLQDGRAAGAPEDEVRLNYLRTAETDALGLYMASLFTDVFYEDLFEPRDEFPAIPADQLYERVRALERLYPPNRGYSLQVVRQKRRHRS
jgi:hypothetical protein